MRLPTPDFGLLGLTSRFGESSEASKSESLSLAGRFRAFMVLMVDIKLGM